MSELPPNPPLERPTTCRVAWFFDSKLTTHANLSRLHNELDITFVTLRRRSPKLMAEIATLPRSA